MMNPKYIVLYNPHSDEWLLFNYVEGREKYAPNYGTPVSNGPTPRDAIDMAVDMFGVNPDEVECY